MSQDKVCNYLEEKYGINKAKCPKFNKPTLVLLIKDGFNVEMRSIDCPNGVSEQLFLEEGYGLSKKEGNNFKFKRFTFKLDDGLEGSKVFVYTTSDDVLSKSKVADNKKSYAEDKTTKQKRADAVKAQDAKRFNPLRGFEDIVKEYINVIKDRAKYNNVLTDLWSLVCYVKEKCNKDVYEAVLFRVRPVYLASLFTIIEPFKVEDRLLPIDLVQEWFRTKSDIKAKSEYGYKNDLKADLKQAVESIRTGKDVKKVVDVKIKDGASMYDLVKKIVGNTGSTKGFYQEAVYKSLMVNGKPNPYKLFYLYYLQLMVWTHCRLVHTGSANSTDLMELFYTLSGNNYESEVGNVLKMNKTVDNASEFDLLRLVKLCDGFLDNPKFYEFAKQMPELTRETIEDEKFTLELNSFELQRSSTVSVVGGHDEDSSSSDSSSDSESD
jgi:hypothetical protein